MGSQWDATKGILADVENLVSTSKDADTVRECRELNSKIEQAYEMGQVSAAELIKICQAKVEESRERSEELAARTPTSPEIDALEQERKGLEIRIKEQRMEKEEVEKFVKEIETKVNEMESSLEGAKNEYKDQIPLMKHSLSLYANVSKIKWDFSGQNRREIAGTVCGSGVTQKFCLDEEQNSSFQIANQLWELIGTVQ
mmetsp:Transcript_17887/g.29018  ORF Transcript_17887/g.29018 Transcript_17887/m.29018 type:complete len:199 (+) Transcript_17887:146-742(+)